MANEIVSVIAPSLGALVGRIQPTNWIAPDGSYVLALGADKTDYVIDTWPAYRLGINGVYPTGYAGGETLQIAPDRGATQTITFLVADQTLAQVIDRINATLTGAIASDVDGELKIETISRGLNSHINIVAGTGLVKLGHLVTTGVGYGGVHVGDYFGFTQQWDITLITLISFKMKMIQPTNTDIKFRFFVTVDGKDMLTVMPAVGDTVDFVERRVNVSSVAGNVNVSFVLEAVAA